MGNEHRDKIKNSNILKALIQHVDGKREMTSSQVTAGLGLLKKVMPDLQSVALSNEDDKPLKIEDTSGGAAKLADFLSGIAERSAEASKPDS